MNTLLRKVGKNGQLSLGKQFAGRQVRIETIGDEKWLMTSVEVIPKSEVWLHEPSVAGALSRAVTWAENTAPVSTDLDVLEQELRSRS